MAERIKRALVLREMTPADLIAQKVLSKAGVYFLLDGTTTSEKVRDTTMTKLCKALRVNREWLQNGRGPIEGVDFRAEPDWSDVTGYAQAVGLGGGAEADEYAETHSLKFKTSSLRKRGIYGRPLHVYYGKGDSMAPTIKDGDAILFDSSDTRPADGGLFVVQVDREIYVKRAEILDDAVYFRSDNPNGDHNWRKPRRMDDKRNPVTILGRVHWIAGWAE